MAFKINGNTIIDDSRNVLIANVESANSLSTNTFSIGTQANKATLSYTVNVARTYTIPNTGANSEFVMSDGSQTISGEKTFSNSLSISSSLPNISFVETDTTTAARLMVDGGVTFLQAGAAGSGAIASSGSIRLSGYAENDISSFSVKSNGSYQNVYHDGYHPNADTLTSAVTLWGQSFNGSVNISGDLSSVGNITGSSGIAITAGGSNQNITLNPSGTGKVGVGTTSPATLLGVLGTGSTAKIRLQSSSNGQSTIRNSSTEPALELVSYNMNITSAAFPPAIKFGSTDEHLTTVSPKFGAAIVGRASEIYSADTHGGMDLVFMTVPNSPGAAAVDMTERMRVRNDGIVDVKSQDGRVNVYATGASTGPRISLWGNANTTNEMSRIDQLTSGPVVISADPDNVFSSSEVRLQVDGSTIVAVSPTGANITGSITGTAVTQSTLDTTVGRIVKVGDFGLGNTGIVPSSTYASLGDVTTFVSDTVNGAPSDKPSTNNSHAGLHIAAASNKWVEILGEVGGATDTAKLSWRRNYDGTVSNWQQIFSQGNILGTVSQTSGIPTGAVIERGSNTNGEYVRFADGTQICTRFVNVDALSIAVSIGSVYRSDNLPTYDYPIAFSGPIFYANAVLSGSDHATIRNAGISIRLRRGQNTKTLAWEGISVTSASSVTGTTGEETRIFLIAIGKWFT